MAVSGWLEVLLDGVVAQVDWAEANIEQGKAIKVSEKSGLKHMYIICFILCV